MTSSAISTPTRTPMPARISRGLSLKGRRGGSAGRPAPGRLGVMDVTVAGIRRPPSFLRVQEIFELVRKLVDVAEMPVDRREADVGDLVELLQLLHHERAHVVRRDFLFRSILK